MKLYYLKGACSLVPHIALEWIGAGYQAEEVNRKYIKSPEYLKLNPQGSVPLLIDGDFILSQNVAILFYLDACHPEAKLFGADTIEGKARGMRWLTYANSDLHPTFGVLFHPANNLDEPTKSLLQQNARERILNLLAQANNHLAQHQTLGDELSVADIYLYVILRWCNGLSLDYSHLSNLPAFYQRIEANPHVQSVLKMQGLQ
ncbi:glutathione binding-like protein [Suttonella ornithocola]